MKKNVFLILFLCLFFQLNAQSQNVNITGTVFDEASKESVELASIRVLNAKDSVYVTGAVTNETGKFSVAVKPGKYIVHISFLGYLEQHVNINTQENSAIGNIYLKEDGILLSEAVVEAKAIEVQIKGDTVEYNADSYKVQKSAVVEDLLKKMPGAEIDSDGKITINGKEIKKILVDGKEFFSDDPKVASKNLPAEIVDKLQVLDRKSDMAQMTGFDDGEEETVINLTVKKGMKEGLYGSATAGIGGDDRYGVSGIANYMRNNSQFTLMGGSNNTNNEGFTDNASGSFGGMRGGRMNFGGRNGISQSNSGGFNFATETSNKLKWGGNIRYGHTDNDVEQSSFKQKYMIGDTKGDQYENRKNIGDNKSTNISGDFRFEWAPDEQTKIIFSPNMRYGENTNLQQSDYLTSYLNANDSINWGQSKTYSDGNSKNVSGRLDVSRQLGKKGRVLSISLSGGFSELENNGTNWSNTIIRKPTMDSTILVDQVFKQNNDGHNWRGYMSYVEPVGKNNFLQFNYSYRKNYSESDKNTLKNDGFGNYTMVDTTATKKLENDFINQEIGLNFKSIREKYNYTIGVALQPSSSKSWTITPQITSQVKNDVLNFAPIAQFNYLWDKRHNLRLDYNGSTNQPSTTQLSNVRDESDPLNISYGNPDLKPSFSNRLRLRYQKSNPEQGSSLMMFGGFNFSTNDIVTKKTNLSGGISETTYDNINGNWSANLRVIMNRPLRNKKFSFNSAAFGNYDRSNGFIDKDKNTASTITLAESAGLQYRADLLDFGLRGNFRYSNTKNSLPNQEDRIIYNYGGSFNTTLRLPYDFTIESDITYSANSGSTNGYEQNEWLWNAAIYKQLFKAKNGTIKVNAYDILHQRTNISQSATAREFSETITNTIKPYVMVSFAYRFQSFKGGAKRSDTEGDGGGWGGRGQGGPPPGGGGSRRMF